MRSIKPSLKCLLPVAAVLALSATGLLYGMEKAFDDAWYQQRRETDEQIVIVGIDEKALQDIGPFQTWGRGTMAMVLEALNQGEDRPAVIGVDVLYAGETDAEQDGWLAEEAGRYGNVVMASAAQFGPSLVVGEDQSFYMDSFAVLGYETAYDSLYETTQAGHINAMMDRDGVLRHVLSEVRLPSGEAIPSFSTSVARMFWEFQGQEALDMPPVDGRGFWYLPYTGKPGDFYDGISVSDVLEGDIPADYFAGKIVLIGPYATGMNDSYSTAIDHAEKMYGVEYQANAIAALLSGAHKKEAPWGLQWAVLAVILLAASCWLQGRAVMPAAVATIGAMAAWMGLCHLLYNRGTVLSVMWVPSGMAVLFISSVASNYIREGLEKRRITDTFKRYVAPEIVNELLREGTETLGLGGKLCDITVMFVDIRGFTAMSEVLEPPTVVEILNRHLSLTSACIMEHKGTLDKFMGDATMAFWGAPLPQEDSVMLAARAAMDMVEGSKALSDELMERYGRTVSFGIGLHTGPAVVGNIGASMRMDYTAIGDTVNTAARLESNAPSGKIYISRAVANALSGRIEVTSLGESIPLKGKRDGFEVLTLDRIIDEASR